MASGPGLRFKAGRCRLGHFHRLGPGLQPHLSAERPGAWTPGRCSSFPIRRDGFRAHPWLFHGHGRPKSSVGKSDAERFLSHLRDIANAFVSSCPALYCYVDGEARNREALRDLSAVKKRSVPPNMRGSQKRFFGNHATKQPKRIDRTPIDSPSNNAR